MTLKYVVLPVAWGTYYTCSFLWSLAFSPLAFLRLFALAEDLHWFGGARCNPDVHVLGTWHLSSNLVTYVLFHLMWTLLPCQFFCDQVVLSSVLIFGFSFVETDGVKPGPLHKKRVDGAEHGVKPVPLHKKCVDDIIFVWGYTPASHDWNSPYY